MSAIDFEDDRDPTGSIRQCYEIIPPDEAMAIWNTCPLPDATRNDVAKGKNDGGDEPDIYIA